MKFKVGEPGMSKTYEGEFGMKFVREAVGHIVQHELSKVKDYDDTLVESYLELLDLIDHAKAYSMDKYYIKGLKRAVGVMVKRNPLLELVSRSTKSELQAFNKFRGRK